MIATEDPMPIFAIIFLTPAPHSSEKLMKSIDR